MGVQGAALFGGLAFAADYGIDSFTSWRERQAEALLLAKTRQKEGKEEEGDKPLEVPLRGGKSQAPYIPARKPPSTAPPINDFWANTPAWFPVRRMDWDAEEQKLVAQIARIDDLLRLSAPKRPPAAT